MASSRFHRWESSGCTSSSNTFVFNLQEEAEAKGVLGLQLEKKEALLSLLENCSKNADTVVKTRGRRSRDDRNQPAAMSEKLKASNFPIDSISVGTWKRKAKKDGELTAKVYFAKKKVVWEFLDGNLKSKMEVSWSDLTAHKAIMVTNQPGILQIELAKPPSFFKELEPQPRKHTNWQKAADFTDGQALIYRRHFVTFPPGELDQHYEKLLQFDQHLYELSKRPFPSHESPFFNTTPLLPFHLTPSLQLQQQQQQWTTTCPDLHQFHQSSQQQQQQQQQQQLQYYPTSSMHNMPTNQDNQWMNYLQTEGAGYNEASIMNNVDEMAAVTNMWTANQAQPPLIDMLQQQQQWGCSSSSSCEYGEDGNLNETLRYYPIVPGGDRYHFDGYGYGYGGMGFSASDVQEVLKIHADEKSRWLIPHILSTNRNEYSPRFDIMHYISTLHDPPPEPPHPHHPTNIQQ